MQCEPALVLHEPEVHLRGDVVHDHRQSGSERPQQQHHQPEDDIGDGETDDDLPADLLLHKSEHCPNLLGEPRRSQCVTCSSRLLVSLHTCLLSLLESSPTLRKRAYGSSANMMIRSFD